MQARKHAHVRGTRVWFILTIREKDSTSFFSLGSHYDPTMRAAQNQRANQRATAVTQPWHFTRVHPGNCNRRGGEVGRYLGCVVAEIREHACLAVWLPSFALIIPLPGLAFATRQLRPDCDLPLPSPPLHECCTSDNPNAFVCLVLKCNATNVCVCVNIRVSFKRVFFSRQSFAARSSTFCILTF